MSHLPIILGSNSPRRLQLLLGAGFDVTRVSSGADEDFDAQMPLDKVAAYLAEKKMDAIAPQNQIIVTADTTVVFPDFILNKPANEAEARYMLQQLSGNLHRVITGVCLRHGNQKIVFQDETKVWFSKLSEDVINQYILTGNPYDKAGAYGIQDSIGYLGIEKIEGCFYNVMGLPIRRVYEEYLKLM